MRTVHIRYDEGTDEFVAQFEVSEAQIFEERARDLSQVFVQLSQALEDEGL